jgi:hypothetical protein
MFKSMSYLGALVACMSSTEGGSSGEYNPNIDRQNATGPTTTQGDNTTGEGSTRPNPESEKVDTTGGGEPQPGADSIDQGADLPPNTERTGVDSVDEKIADE